MNRQTYENIPGWTQSHAKAFASCRETYWHEHIAKTWPRKPSTPEQLFGMDVETFLERGELDLAIIPSGVLASNGAKRGKAWTEWIKDQSSDLRIVKQHEAEAITTACDAIREQVAGHQFAARILDDDIRWQQVVFGKCEYSGLDLKGMLDCLDAEAGTVWDVKTTSDASPDEFAKQVLRYRYHWQAAWYLELACADEFFWIAIQSSPPYRVEVYECGHDWLTMARNQIREVRLSYAEQMDRPGPWRNPSHGKIVPLFPPAWAWRG